jgi:3-hydroxyacyl-CoA dehydrogenase / enoyl-CoA hydratase / 3-hydroxybutyryl-CoA epimerase
VISKSIEDKILVNFEKVTMHFQIDETQSDRISIAIDVENRSVNVLNEQVLAELDQILDRLLADQATQPVVFRSAKQKGFVVGADLKRIVSIDTDDAIRAFLGFGQSVFTKLGALPCDTIAIINGPCLGGGLEFAMACRYRLAIDQPATQLGMPESKLGLMPGWGGTQRLIELVGVELGTKMLLSGEPVSAVQALEIGLVDELCELERIDEQLTTFLAQRADSQASQQQPSQPWLGTPNHGNSNAGDVEPLSALEQICKESFPMPTPAQQAIVQAIRQGMLQGRDCGYRAERELFFSLLPDPEVRDRLTKFAAPKANNAGSA